MSDVAELLNRLPLAPGPIIGIAGKEIVRRAIVAVHAERRDLQATRKADKGDRPDFVTNADHAAQRIYLKSLLECCPGVGVIAEEDGVSVPCQIPGLTAYWTIDGVDGTKALMRGQSHGVGTMVSLVIADQVVAAFIGDVMTGEIYYYRPGSEKVHRLWDFTWPEELVIDDKLPLAEQYLLLRELPERSGRLVQGMTRRPSEGGLFRNVEVGGGSIGLAYARLLKGEIGGLVLDPTTDTPWDWCPTWGLANKIGFDFIELNEERPIATRVVELGPISKTAPRERELLVIHKSRWHEFGRWLK